MTNNNPNFAVINDGVIEIAFPFAVHVLEIVRDIPGREWNNSSHPGVWIVPHTPWHCWKVIEELKPLGFWIDPDIRKCADHKAPAPKLDFKLPKGLYPFQREGVKFMYQHGGRVILGDAPGVGKTAQALAMMGFVRKVLVVCPQNVLWKWKRDAERWAGDKTSQVILTGKNELSDANIHIMSYGIMTAKLQELRRVPYDMLIVDEAHALKNYKAKRTRAAKVLVRDGIKHVIFLTGTPLLNRPIELYSLLEMIDSKTWGNWASFVTRYCEARRIGGQWIIPPNGASNLEELRSRLQDFMIRRTKEEVNEQLPELTRDYIPVDLDNWDEYKQATSSLLTWVRENKKSLTHQNVLVKLNVLRQIAGKGKVSSAIELAESLLENEERIVLFAHHREVVEELQKGLSKYNVGLIVGGVPAKKRDEQVRNFLNPDLREEEKIRVMICSTAGSEGIDLYSASHVIFTEREWTPAQEEQMEARLHRNGQKNAVTAHYLMGRGTIDEKIADAVSMKRGIIEQIIQQPEIAENWLEEA